MLGKEGPELPPSRPTLTMTHPELQRQGEQILKDIMDISEEGNKGEDIQSFLERLPGLFEKMSDFIGATLSTRGPNDGVAYWAEQTYKAVQRIEKGVLSPPPTTRATSPAPRNT